MVKVRGAVKGSVVGSEVLDTEGEGRGRRVSAGC